MIHDYYENSIESSDAIRHRNELQIRLEDDEIDEAEMGYILGFEEWFDE